MLRDDAHRYVSTLKDISAAQPLLGCGNCADRNICGELHLRDTGALLLSCMEHCTCADAENCPFVCPRSTVNFFKRHDEVDGWDLDNIPPVRDLTLPRLPEWVPLFQGNLTGRRPWSGEPLIALPLTLALTGTGQTVRGRTSAELVRRYGARPSQGWVLSGTEDDPAVERIWQIPDLSRVARQLAHAGAVLATTPNFSLVVDSPRYDNLHAMKRIAWAWYRMTQGGLCTALHLNGRTDHDFARWAAFVKKRPQVKAVAFEFLTGSATKESADLYVERLCRFASDCGRRLPLIMRGHAALSDKLAGAFERIVLLDSSPYMRATKRRKAFVKSNGVLGHALSRTTSPKETRALLLHNLQVHRARALAPRRHAAAQGELDFRFAPPEVQADNEPCQRTLFPNERICV